MKPRFAALGTLCIAVPLLAYAQGPTRICPVKGQQFPAPKAISKEAAFKNATKLIEHHIAANITSSPFNETTFSVGLFSVDEENLIWEYHHADANVTESKLGATTVNADSIYRIGSISKVLTVYLWIIRQGDRKFSDPITDHLPQLLDTDPTKYDYAVPSWSEITIGDLASYSAGIIRDYGLNDLALATSVTTILPASINNLPNNAPGVEVPACGFLSADSVYETCSNDTYVRGLKDLAASFPSSYTPLYSNANFAILGIALEAIIGSSMEAIFNTSLVEPLGLTGTTYGNPVAISNRSVIYGGDEKASGWDNALGPLNAAAGQFSTTNDLARIGRSILNHTLILKPLTRRWFHTTTLVDELDQGVGRGWEIFRRQLNGRTVDLYTKSGYWGAYQSFFALIPEYNFGFSVLTAAQKASGKVKNDLPNIIVNTLLPALDEIAKQQAHQNFEGHYTVPGSNTSLTITTDTQSLGLKVTEYIISGIDIISTIFGLFGSDIDFRLKPNHLYHKNKVGFTGIYQPPQKALPDGEWYWPCQTWLDIDDFTFGSVPLGQVVFEVDGEGKACGVELKAARQKLTREGGDGRGRCGQ